MPHTNSRRAVKDESICQQSAKIAANIIRAMSFYLARITLGRATAPRAPKRGSRKDDIDGLGVNSNLNDQKKQLQDPEKHTRQSAQPYLMEPPPEAPEEVDVDKMAENFIHKFRKRNLDDPNAVADQDSKMIKALSQPIFEKASV
ncbi:hypothetical protein QJS10_CPB17g00625 [Acorus calamus]|uniref:Uncharacterized protein n=1 Tax=Acorus calamus TaxID=4465 RepID=A0AAV9CWR2_ACOCL|nr:hypothetical protein QJS10_CPB17g00625 [Acorus calamus]